MNKIKILIYTTIFDNGGAERFILDLINNIDLEIFEVILTIGRKKEIRYLQFLKKYEDIKYINLGYLEGQDNLIYKKLADSIKKERPDICFAPGIFTNFILLDAINSIDYKGKLILRESNYISLRTNLSQDIYEKFKDYNKADRIVSITEKMGDDLAKYGVDKSKIVAISNPVEISDINKKANEKVENREFNKIKNRKIIHVGRLEDQKNHTLLLKAFKKLTKKVADIDLILIGIGSKEQELKDLCQKLQITQKVHFLGFEDNPYYFIKNSDLLVLSSKYEGLPHVLLEAMALKVPTIATDCLTGPRELFGDSEYGYLVKNNSITSLSKKMIELLKNENKLTEKVELAYERALENDAKNIVKKYQDLFIDIAFSDPVTNSYRKEGVKIGKNFSAVGPVNFGSEPYLIELGDDVRISSQVSFVTHDGGMHVIRQYKNIPADSFGQIKVGNNVFIGMNAIILKGVTIGDNVVIGAGSIVTKSIPSNSIACGIPAKVIETLDEYYEKNKDQIDLTKNFQPEEKKKYLLEKYNK